MEALIAYTIILLYIPAFIMLGKRDKKHAALSLILLALVVSSCEKEEIQIYDNSRLYFEYSCNDTKFTYDFIVNEDTITFKENVLNYKVTDRATVSKGDIIQLSFHTDEPGAKELAIYVNSHLWACDTSDSKTFSKTYIVE